MSTLRQHLVCRGSKRQQLVRCRSDRLSAIGIQDRSHRTDTLDMTPDPTQTPAPVPYWGRRRVRETSDLRLRVLTLVALALLQAVVVGVTGSGVTRILAVALLLPSLGARLRTLSLLAAFIVVNFVVHSLTLPPSLPWRLAHILVVVAYGAVALAALVGVITRLRFAHALVITGGLGALLVSTEALATTRVTPLMRVPRYLIGIGNATPDETFGGVYRPYGEWQSQYPDDLQGYLRASTGEPAQARGPFTVTYSANALGCRGSDVAIPNPRTERRVLLLGGSGAFGIGVREPDTVSGQLGRLLNASPALAGGRPVVVINCALAGAGTSGQRAFYEQIAERYEPEVVVLLLGERDNLSARDELDRRFVHAPGAVEAWFSLARLWQWSRYEGRRPFEYGAIGEELTQLRASVQIRRSRLVVALFRVGPPDERWRALQAVVTTAVGADAGVRVVDLGTAVTAGDGSGGLTVHPFDPHPNHRAHALAAQSLSAVFERERLLE